MKILFQGDSITDAGRDRADIHNMGFGYPLYASRLISEKLPFRDIEFVNLGISGDQTKDLVARLQSDFIDIQPDVCSIHIGVNDTWHHAADRNWLSNDIFEAQYRQVLTALKEQTKAKIIMIEQYLLPAEDKLFFREDLDGKIDITRKLAKEFADYYIPLDGIINAACINTGNDFTYYSDDGVHPNENGAAFIGKLYADALLKVLG